MQVNLTDSQLSRIIELLQRAKENRTDDYLINYLRQHQNSVYAAVISLDEIPF
jgi:hypothetical protein